MEENEKKAKKMEVSMNKKQFAVTLVCTVVFAFLGGVLSGGFFQGSAMMAQEKQAVATGGFSLEEGLFIGVVEKGKFRVLVPQQSLGGFARLTEIQMQEARPPESAELYLEKYEGKAIMVSGHDGGSWIYRAAVIDSGGPLMTALVRKVFN